MKKSLTLSLVLASTLFSAGYQIPNNSINSIALSTANVANAHGADAAYFNPANMVKSDAGHEIEISATYVKLNSVDYTPIKGLPLKSKTHKAVIPSLHYVSKKLTDSGVRIGFSIVSPAGLSREWTGFPAIATAEKFALETIEFNPSVAIPISENLSFGVGFRYVRASGDVKLNGLMIPNVPGKSMPYQMEMSGKDSASYGYNFALSYNPTEALNISATYRSKIILDLEGVANVNTIIGPISTGVSLQTPIPANFILATAYTFSTDTTLEVTYDRTMWSAVKVTDMNFDNPFLEYTLGRPTAKNWKDTVAYRMGITQKLDALTLMGGIAYSTHTTDDQHLSFSSPDSDSMTYSLGGRYAITDDLDIGLAVLYSANKDRTVYQTQNPLGVNGTFSNKSVYTINSGISYKF